MNVGVRKLTHNLRTHKPNKVESVLIAAALYYTQSKRRESALLLGYGRNTLTRKIKELELDVP